MNGMTHDNSIDTSIDRFLSGEMPPEEMTAFRSQLASNPEYSNLLAADRLVLSNAARERTISEASIAAQPNAAIMSYLKRVNPAKRFLTYGYIGAGCFTVLLSTLLYFTTQSATHAPSPTPHPATTVVGTTPARTDTTQEVLPATETPRAENVAPVSPQTTPRHVGAAAQPAPPTVRVQAKKAEVPRDFDEGLGKPRIYKNDSLAIPLHTK